MSQHLMNWVQNQKLSRKVNNFEEDFSNGYLFNDLLHQFGQVCIDSGERWPGPLRDDYAVEAKVTNFKILERSLNNLKIKFTPGQAQQINNKHRGVAMKLIYQIKMVLDRLNGVQTTLQQHKQRMEADAFAHPAAAAHLASAKSKESGVSPDEMDGDTYLFPEILQNQNTYQQKDNFKLIKSLSLPRPIYDRQNKLIFENRFRCSLENPKECRKAIIQKRFFEEKLIQEERKNQLDTLEFECFMADRARNRNVLREKIARNRYFLDQWHAEGVEEWRKNMGIRMHAIESKMRFDQRCAQKEADLKEKVRLQYTGHVVRGIARFEQMLEDKALVSDDLREMKPLEEVTEVENGEELLQLLEGRLPTIPQQRDEAYQFLGKIKEAKVAGSIARQTREKRRRKVLVTVQQDQDRSEAGFFEKLLAEQLDRSSIEEQRVDYEVWKTGQYEHVMRTNRQARVESYQQRRDVDFEQLVSVDQGVADIMKRQVMDESVELEQFRYKAVERNRIAAEREKVIDHVEELWGQIENLAVESSELRVLDDTFAYEDAARWVQTITEQMEALKVAAAEAAEKEAAAGDPKAKAKAKPKEEVTTPEPTGPEPFAFNPDIPQETVPYERLDIEFQEYLNGTGQWAHELVPIEIMEEAIKANILTEGLEQAESTIPFVPYLNLNESIESGKNLRLGCLIDGCISTTFEPGPPEMPEPLPVVPLRLCIHGWEYAGKKLLAFRLCELFNLKLIILDDVVKECLALAGHPASGSHMLEDMVISREGVDDAIAKARQENNPYMQTLKDIGTEMAQILFEGGKLSSEQYIRMIIAKIRACLVELKEDHPEYPEPATVDSILQPHGYILCGFPRTKEEASQLEWELSGFLALDELPTTEDMVRGARAEILAPRPVPKPLVQRREVGGFDKVLQVVTPPQQVVRRATGRCIHEFTKIPFHLMENPPPKKTRSKEDLVYEKLIPAEDITMAVGTLAHRMHHTDREQPKLLQYWDHFEDPDIGPRVVQIHSDASASTRETVYKELVHHVEKIMHHRNTVWQGKCDALAEKLRLEEEERQRIEAERLREEEEQRQREEAARLKAEAKAERRAEKQARIDAGEPQEGHDVESEDSAAEEEAPAEEVTAEEPAAAEEAAEEEGEPPVPPFEPLDFVALKDAVFQLDSQYQHLVNNAWEAMQSGYSVRVGPLYEGTRNKWRELFHQVFVFRLGIVEYLKEEHHFKRQIDGFAVTYNGFYRENPEMILEDDCKEMLQARVQTFREELLEQLVPRVSNVNLAIDSIVNHPFVDHHITMTCQTAQALLWMEGKRYVSTRHFINDVFHKMLRKHVPAPPPPEEEAQEPVDGEESKEPEEPPPPPPVELDPEPEMEWPDYFTALEEDAEPLPNVRVWNAETEQFEFPALVASLEFARGIVAPHTEVEWEEEEKAHLHLPTYVDWHQTLWTERVLYLQRLQKIESWVQRYCTTIQDQYSTLISDVKQWAEWKETYEREAVTALCGHFDTLIDEHKNQDYRLTMDQFGLEVTRSTDGPVHARYCQSTCIEDARGVTYPVTTRQLEVQHRQDVQLYIPPTPPPTPPPEPEPPTPPPEKEKEEGEENEEEEPPGEEPPAEEEPEPVDERTATERWDDMVTFYSDDKNMPQLENDYIPIPEEEKEDVAEEGADEAEEG